MPVAQRRLSSGLSACSVLFPQWPSVLLRIFSPPDCKLSTFNFPHNIDAATAHPVHSSYNLQARAAGKAVRFGRGPATVFGSRRKPGYPPVPRFAPLLARGSCAIGPELAGRFCFYPVADKESGSILESRSGLNHRAPIYAVRRAAVLAFCFFAAFPAQAAHARIKQSAANAAPESFRTFTDETGRTVRIPVQVRRVVSLAPSVTETIYALGMQNLLVGDTDYCDYPEAAKQIHKVGGATNPSLEEIGQLKPDVVLVIKSLNRLETVQQLERLGIPTYSTDPHTLDEIRSSAHRLADVLGNPAAGEALDHTLLQKEKELQQRLHSVTPTRALFVVWTEPLISVGKHTFIADALAHAGAASIVDSSQDWPQISLEEIVRLQPDYLIFADSHSERAARDVEALARRPGWNLLGAVKHRKFAVISDAINRPAPRLFDAIDDLARQLHPEAFSNVTAAFRGGRFCERIQADAAKGAY